MKNLREPEDTLGYEVKQLTDETIEQTIGVLPLKTKPLAHQARSLYLSLAEDSWLYSLDMGLGKTKISLDIATTHKALEGSVRVMVSCPPIVVGQWARETEKHSDLSIQLVDSYSSEGKLKQLERSSSDVTVASHNWLVSLFTRSKKSELMDKHLLRLFSKFDILIIDEAHALRNPATKGFIGYRHYLLGIKKRYLLSGTPVGNNYTGVWGLYYLLDKGETFGKSYQKYLDNYFRVYNTGRFNKYTLRKDKEAEFGRLFWKRQIRWQEHDCQDLPEKTYTVIPVQLNSQQREAYQKVVDIEKKSRDAHKLNPFKSVKEVRNELMKITAGVGGTSHKLEVLEDIVRDVCVYKKQQLIIWVWLRSENERIMQHLNKKGSKIVRVESFKSGLSEEQRASILAGWYSGKVDVLVANQKSLGIGVDLFQASTCVFFSNNTSIVDRKQAEKRIHRTGQTKPCTYIDIVAAETIDEINLDILDRAQESTAKLTKDSDVVALATASWTKGYKKLCNY